MVMIADLIICMGGIGCFDKHRALELKRGAFFSRVPQVGNGTIDLGDHQGTKAV